MNPEQTRRAEIARLLSEGGTLSAVQLQTIADGGLMDANRIYLPAGKITEAEYRAREARIMKGDTP